MARNDGVESMLIEAGDQVCNGIAGAAASCLGCGAVAQTGSNSKQRFGAGTVAGRFRLRARETFECSLFFRAKQSKRVFLAAGHDAPLSSILE